VVQLLTKVAGEKRVTAENTKRWALAHQKNYAEMQEMHENRRLAQVQCR